MSAGGSTPAMLYMRSVVSASVIYIVGAVQEAVWVASAPSHGPVGSDVRGMLSRNRRLIASAQVFAQGHSLRCGMLLPVQRYFNGMKALESAGTVLQVAQCPYMVAAVGVRLMLP